MKVCSQCGQEVQDVESICPRCGYNRFNQSSFRSDNQPGQNPMRGRPQGMNGGPQGYPNTGRPQGPQGYPQGNPNMGRPQGMNGGPQGYPNTGRPQGNPNMNRPNMGNPQNMPQGNPNMGRPNGPQGGPQGYNPNMGRPNGPQGQQGNPNMGRPNGPIMNGMPQNSDNFGPEIDPNDGKKKKFGKKAPKGKPKEVYNPDDEFNTQANNPSFGGDGDVVSFGEWFKTMLLMIIPIYGIYKMIIILIGSDKINRNITNCYRASIVFSLVLGLLMGVLTVGLGAIGLSALM